MRSRVARPLTLPAPALGAVVVGIAAAVLIGGAGPAAAAQPPVGLGTATGFAVLGATTVTNTGPSVISGDVGVSPGTALVGFPPAIIVGGTEHVTDAVAAQAQGDVTTAYNDTAGRGPVTSVAADLAGRTLAPGVYGSPTLGLTGSLTLDAGGDPSAVFVFQASSTLITASSSTIALVNGASPCNVYWKVGSSATLGTTSTFVGTVLALTSITADTNAHITGRLFARNAAVSLHSNVIDRPTCTTTSSSSSTPSSSSPSSSGPSSTRPGSSSAAGSGVSSTAGGGGAGGPAGSPLRTSDSAAAAASSAARAATSRAAGSTTVSPPVLAATGTDLGPVAGGGALAVALGGLVLLASRRRALTARHRS